MVGYLDLQQQKWLSILEKPNVIDIGYAMSNLPVRAITQLICGAFGTK